MERQQHLPEGPGQEEQVVRYTGREAGVWNTALSLLLRSCWSNMTTELCSNLYTFTHLKKHVSFKCP